MLNLLLSYYIQKMLLITYLKKKFPHDFLKTFIIRKQKIEENLNLINPCMKLSWNLWNRDFR
jgi:hypothetical protein